MGPKSSNEIPGLAVDFIKVMTLEMIDLRNFEKTMGHYRETGGYTGTLVKLRTEPSSPNVSKLEIVKDEHNHKKPATIIPKKVLVATPVTKTEEAPKYVPKHVILEPFTVKDHYFGGEFGGKIMIK